MPSTGARRSPVDLDPLARVRNVAPRWREPVADDCCADHVGDETDICARPMRREPGTSCRGGRPLSSRSLACAADRSRPAERLSARECATGRCPPALPSPTKNLRRGLRLDSRRPRPAPTFATDHWRRSRPSRQAPSCCRHSRSDPGARSDFCSHQHCATGSAVR